MGEPAEKQPRPLYALTDVELAELVRDTIRDELAKARATPAVENANDELTTAQAALALGISREALRHHVSRGHITPDFPGGKRGRKTHGFTRSTIDAFRRRTGGNSEE